MGVHFGIRRIGFYQYVHDDDGDHDDHGRDGHWGHNFHDRLALKNEGQYLTSHLN